MAKVVRWVGGYSIETEDNKLLKDLIKGFEAMDSGLFASDLAPFFEAKEDTEDELVCPECNGTLFEELPEYETEETITLRCDNAECGADIEIPKDNMEEGE